MKTYVRLLKRGNRRISVDCRPLLLSPSFSNKSRVLLIARHPPVDEIVALQNINCMQFKHGQLEILTLTDQGLRDVLYFVYQKTVIPF